MQGLLLQANNTPIVTPQVAIWNRQNNWIFRHNTTMTIAYYSQYYSLKPRRQPRWRGERKYRQQTHFERRNSKLPVLVLAHFSHFTYRSQTFSTTAKKRFDGFEQADLTSRHNLSSQWNIYHRMTQRRLKPFETINLCSFSNTAKVFAASIWSHDTPTSETQIMKPVCRRP